jgi:hypothetical protein
MEVFKSNFFSPIIKDSITETPNNVKMSNKSSPDKTTANTHIALKY